MAFTKKRRKEVERLLSRRLQQGMQAVEEGSGRFPGLELENEVTDTLTNIMHLCDPYGVDFNRCLRLARSHHKAQVTEYREVEL